MNKYTLALLLGALALVSHVHGASIWVDHDTAKKVAKRDITVDGRGFYLGGGSNNNLREASQLFDLGGPIANPWINPWTQPMPRTGIFTVPVPAPVGGAIAHPPPPPPAAAPAPAPAPVQAQAPAYGGYAQQAAPVAAPAYGGYAQQAAPAPVAAPAYGGYAQQAAPAPVAAPAYGGGYAQAAAPAPAPVAAPSYGGGYAQQAAPAAPVLQNTYNPYYPGDHSQLGAQAPAAPVQAPIQQAPIQQSGGYGGYAQAAPAPAPVAAPSYAQAAPSYAQAAPVAAPAYGQQTVQAPVPVQQAGGYGGYGATADQGVALQAGHSLAESSNNKPFTAVFVPGQPTLFKLGTPGDIQTGSYTSI